VEMVLDLVSYCDDVDVVCFLRGNDWSDSPSRLDVQRAIDEE